MGTVAASGTIVVHQVPEGFTSILKNVWVNNAESVVNNIQVLIRPLAGQPDIYVFASSLQPAEGKEIILWFVLEDGDQLLARSLGGSYRVWANGAILPNVPA